MNVDERGVLLMPNPYFFNGRFGLRPRYIIVHGTAGGSSAQNVANWLARPNVPLTDQSSVHYLIGQDGTIVQAVSEANGAYGNGFLSQGHAAFWNPNVNPNFYTISIEHVKSTEDNSAALTPAQQTSSFRLIEDICNRWGIPKHLADATGGITGHFSIDPVNRARCPGNYPWNALWTYLAPPVQQHPVEIPVTPKPVPVVNNPPAWLSGVLSPEEAQNDFDVLDANHWRSKKTGKIIQDAILNFYREFGSNGKQGLTYLKHPTSNEIELGGGVVMQNYETAVVCYNPLKVRPDAPVDAGIVYLLSLDDPHVVDTSEITGLKTMLAQDQQHFAELLAHATDIQKQVATLTAQNETLTAQLTGLATQNTALLAQNALLETEETEKSNALVTAQNQLQAYASLAPIINVLKPFAADLAKA